MKRLTLALSLTLSLLYTGEAIATPNMKRIGDEATAGLLDVTAARAVIGSMAAENADLLAKVEKGSAAAAIDQDTIRRGNETIAARDAEIVRITAEAGNTKMNILWLAVASGAGLFGVAGCLGMLFDVGRAGVKCLCIAAVLGSTAAAMAKFPVQFGWLGLGVAAVGTATGLVLLINDLRRHKEAGVDMGTGLQVIRDSGKFDADQLAYIEQTLYTAGSKVADRLRAIGAGVSLKSLLARLKPGKAAA